MSRSETAVIIVSAGRGSRMESLTNDRPKSLIPFAGRPLIEWQLQALSEVGLIDVTIIGGYKHEKLTPYGSRMVINPDWSQTNMVYSLLCAEETFLSGRPVIVAYADIVYEPRILAALMNDRSDASTVIDQNWLALWRLRQENPLDDAETLRVSNDGNILEIGKRPTRLDDIQGQYVGLTKFSDKGAKAFVETYREIEKWQPSKNEANCYFTDVLDAMILSGTKLHAAFTAGGWLEFDTATDLAAYEARLADGTLAAFWSRKSFGEL